MSLRCLGFGAAALSAALALPAAAAMPSFAGYFSGTWTCTSGIASHVTKTFGASGLGNELLLFNPYVDAKGFVHLISEVYAQHGDTVSAIAHPLESSAIYVGTSKGFEGDTLAFTGTLTTANAVIYQHETYTRIDDTHFTRTFEVARSADGPFSAVSTEQCARVSGAPVPSSPPRH